MEGKISKIRDLEKQLNLLHAEITGYVPAVEKNAPSGDHILIPAGTKGVTVTDGKMIVTDTNLYIPIIDGMNFFALSGGVPLLIGNRNSTMTNRSVPSYFEKIRTSNGTVINISNQFVTVNKESKIFILDGGPLSLDNDKRIRIMVPEQNYN
jgi:hypothetical protein